MVFLKAIHLTQLDYKVVSLKVLASVPLHQNHLKLEKKQIPETHPRPNDLGPLAGIKNPCFSRALRSFPQILNFENHW